MSDRGEGDDLVVEASGLLRRGGALLRAQRVFVLRLARHLVALGDDLGGLDHRHVERRDAQDEFGVVAAGAHHLVVLHERDRFDAAADRDRHAVMHDLLGGGGDRHHPGGALPVDRHRRDGVRQPGAHRALARDVRALAALLQRRADDYVVNLGWIDPGAPDRLGNGMPGERLRLGVVEGTAIGSADRRAGAGDNDGAAHGVLHRNIVPEHVVETTEVVVGATGIEPVTPPV